MRIKVPGMLAAAIAVVVLGACTGPGDSERTATPIRSGNVTLQRISGVYPVSDDTLLWVTRSNDVLISASEIEQAHPFTLAGQSVVFASAAEDANTGVAAIVSDDGSVAAIPIRTSTGSGGVALVREDGYNMAVHLYGGPLSFISSIKFMSEVGLTLLSLGDATGSRIIAINNYGLKQFELPVTDSLGTLRYSPYELGYMVIDRRPLEDELELVPFAEPGESTLFRANESTEETNNLYLSLASIITDWK